MGYSIYIQLPNNEELDIDEWIEAAREIEGCRVPDGNGEIFDQDLEEWVPALNWDDRHGRVSINSRAIGSESGSLVGPVWDVIRSLAMVLGAEVRGEEGESFNLESGEIE